jgi:hypothetical protein
VRDRVDAEREPADDRNAGGAETAAERVRDLAPVRARRPRADDRDDGLVAQPDEPFDPPHGEQHRRRVGELTELRGIAGRVAADGRHAQLLEPAAVQVQVASVERVAQVLDPLPARCRQQLGLGEGEQAAHTPGRPIEQAGDALGQHRDQQRAPKAGVAGAHRTRASTPSSRYESASSRSPSRRRARPSRSAIVLATRSTRSWARPLSSSR